MMRIIRNKKNNAQTSIDDYMYVKENIELFYGKIRRIICVFDNRDFIFFEDNFIDAFRDGVSNFIAYLDNGDVLILEGVNCGYGGTGPSTFSRILQELGVEEIIAEKIKYFPSVEVFFDESGLYECFKKGYTPFDTRPQQKMNIDYHIGKVDSLVNIRDRKIYIVNPELCNFVALIKLIENANPLVMRYYIGKNSPMDNYYRYMENEIRSINVSKLDLEGLYESGRKQKLSIEEYRYKQKNRFPEADEVNVIIDGGNYSVLLLIPLELQLNFANLISLQYVGENILFDLQTIKKYENIVGENYNTGRGLFKNFKYLFKKNDESNYIEGTINLGETYDNY